MEKKVEEKTETLTVPNFNKVGYSKLNKLVEDLDLQKSSEGTNFVATGSKKEIDSLRKLLTTNKIKFQ